jgi:nucleoside-diphosphate-sugar epimerase
MPPRYLVTGCAGFIASHVIDRLLQSGGEVVGVDCLDDAYDLRLKHWRLDALLPRQGFTFSPINLCQSEAVEPLFADVLFAESKSRPPFDAVVHLAARTGVRHSSENPWRYFQANVESTLNLLEACRRHGVSKFVLASTSSLYGKCNHPPYREDADANCPLSAYAASKKAAEVLSYVYHDQYGIDVSVLRYFTVYGSAGRPDMSVFRFIRRIAEGEPVVVFGDGSQSRDFTHVDDIALGTVAALQPLGYEIINLGCGQPATLASMIQQIGVLVGKKAQVEHRPSHPADAAITWADVTKAERLLSWRPTIGIEEGLRRTVAWYMAHRDFARSIELTDRNEASNENILTCSES